MTQIPDKCRWCGSIEHSTVLPCTASLQKAQATAPKRRDPDAHLGAVDV